MEPLPKPDDNALLDDIRRMTVSNLHKLTKTVHQRAQFMDAQDADFAEDFKFVWGFTKETMKVIPGLEPKQETGPQLVINISDLPGIADAMAKPVVDTLAHRTVEMQPFDAPEPKYGSAEDVSAPEPTLPPQDTDSAQLDTEVPNDDIDLDQPDDEISRLLGDFDA